jgi:hypothetical protein
MKTPITIQVPDFTGCPFAVSAEDGQRLHDAIAPALKEGKPVALSFGGIETIIAAFLGAAVGQFYGEMAYGDVDALLSTRFLDGEQMETLKRVAANSKRYYENPAAFDQAWAETAEDDAALEKAVEI